MNKTLIALTVALCLSVSTSQAAILWVPGPVVAGGTGSSISVVPAVAFGAAMIYAANTAPHYSLSDSCKLQNVKKEGANYSYASYEHCAK